MTPKPPVLFIGHGSPMFALEPGAAGEALIALGKELPTPRAVLVISPHWETSTPTVSTASQLETIHDFSGFDARLYGMDYAASGSPQAAQEVIKALQTAGMAVLTDETRGLDHGAWVPLRYLMPTPTVPIVPLSIQHARGTLHAYQVGEAIAPLRDQGWLIVASGNITHNLNDWRDANRGTALNSEYALGFSDWVHQQLINKQVDALLAYRESQPDAERAHPRDEHLLPFFTALGAAGPDYQASVLHRGIRDHVIAMDSYLFR
jgi:4,5-DOPA dioxygenase extradiol